MTTFSIMAIGSELLMGQIIDRNSAFIAQRLYQSGFTPRTQVCCDDNIDEITSGLKNLAPTSDVIITTGGLGPTSDDLTRFAVANFLQVSLEFSECSWNRIQTYFHNLGQEAPSSNKVQSEFPQGAISIENSKGTADAFYLEDGSGTVIICLPGPPREMKLILEQSILPYLDKRFSLRPKSLMKIFRVIGLGESSLLELIEPIKDTDIGITYRAHRPFVEVKLIATEDKKEILSSCYLKMLALVEPFLYEKDGENFFQQLAAILKSLEFSVSIFDACLSGAFFEELFAYFSSTDREQCTWIESFQSIELVDDYLEEFISTAPEDECSIIFVKGEDHRWGVGLKYGHIEICQSFELSDSNLNWGNKAKRKVAYVACRYLVSELYNVSSSGSLRM